MDTILFSLNENTLNFSKPVFQGGDDSANQDRFYAVNALPTNWETISNSHLINRVEVRFLVRLTRGFFFLFFTRLALLAGKNNSWHSGYKKPIIDSGTSTLVARASLYLHDAPRGFDLEIA